MWRASRGGPEPVGGPAARGHLGIQVGWILVTTVIVLFLAGFGTYELVQPGGAGGGEGSSPIWTPTSKTILPIQVIGQQWKFTYRYPTFGGFETDQLVVPDNTTIEFNVTSLDVIHSFWAYQLGVKADANPDYNNVAYTTTATARLLHRPLRRALRALARCHVQQRRGGDPAAVRVLGQGSPNSGCARTPSCSRPTPSPTRPTPTAPTAATTPTTWTPTPRWRPTARRSRRAIDMTHRRIALIRSALDTRETSHGH